MAVGGGALAAHAVRVGAVLEAVEVHEGRERLHLRVGFREAFLRGAARLHNKRRRVIIPR